MELPAQRPEATAERETARGTGDRASWRAVGGRRTGADVHDRRRAGTAVAAWVAVVALALACGPAGDGTGGGDGGGTAADGTAAPADARAGATTHADTAARYGVRLSTDRVVYSPGDTIRMRLKVFRRGGRPLNLSFPTAQRYDFVLRGPEGSDPTAVRWRWSEGRFFAQSTASVVLDGGRPSLTATASHPAPGVPGLYRLEGRLSASDWPISAVVPITVTP